MINHLFLYKGRGSVFILSLTSSTDKWGAALVILAIAFFSRSWFSLFRILPQTASWYEQCGQALQARGRAKRRWQTHGGQEVEVERTYVSCSQCGGGFFPSRSGIAGS